MPGYAVDGKRQAMVATGLVAEVKEWEDKPDGGRRPSERQARHEDTGFPLWAVEVLYQQTAFGRVSSVTAAVSVGSAVQPVLGPFTPVRFEGLAVEVRVNKAGGFTESWSAASLAEPAVATPAKAINSTSAAA